MYSSDRQQEYDQAVSPPIALKLACPRSETWELAVRRPRSTPSTASTPSLRSRRSVSSMKELLPLTLSPTGSSSWSGLSAEGAIGHRVDEYFPEVLAQDLELSVDIFTAKNMTAGAPSSSIHIDDVAKQRTCRASLSLPYLAASARVQSLGAIEERRSVVSFLDQHESRADDFTSDLDSISNTNTSEDMTPPSFRRRESVRTAATSLASTNWKPSLKGSSRPPDGACQSSWIDGDSDGEDQGSVDKRNTGSQSPRPPTPLGPDDDGGGMDQRKSNPQGRWGCNESILRRSASPTSRKIPTSPSSFIKPTRPSSALSLRRGDFREIADPYQAPRPFTAPRPMPPRPDQSLPQHPQHSTDASDRPVKNALNRKGCPEPATVDDCSNFEPERAPPEQTMVVPKPNHAVKTPPFPRPAMRNVQSWLDNSLQPCPRSLENDDLARVVPLPPDAMETLRVSVACFPETMLLSSSLTIETIRTYSRKVRQPSIESRPAKRLSSEDSPPHASRRSLWRRVVPRTLPVKDQTHRQSADESSADALSCSSVNASKPWEPLKNIFDRCSDYICDALYAHIVAYNYISALVARNPPPPTKAGRTFTSRACESQQDDIPTKAATVLGLTRNGTARARAINKPFGTWLKEDMMHGQTPAAANHESMQADLLRCICRLVATAKLMAETGEEPVMATETEGADRLFVRSLCEIVRVVEEVC